jgi:lysophospholipase L1-like esterase
MKYSGFLVGNFILVLLFGLMAFNVRMKDEIHFIGAEDKNIQYTGRIDFSDPKKPRFWTAGVYIKAKFKGTSCEIVINDEEHEGSHNYLMVAIDNNTPFKIKTTGKSSTLTAAEGLPPGEHTITICKNTEASVGYLEFVGFRCEGLVSMPPNQKRKMEFIGDSITSGNENDLTQFPCDSGEWYDQQNAYYSYGPIVARQMNSQWHLTSDSGIGLYHSCCQKEFVMPQVFDNVSLSEDSIKWDFSLYQPDVVTICLGQNDGIQDSVKFCAAYVDFIKKIRSYYPKAQILCLSSPMANDKLRAVLKNYLRAIVSYVNKQGDKKVDKFFFSRGFNNGCGGHPDLNDHVSIAEELAGFVKKKMKW